MFCHSTAHSFIESVVSESARELYLRDSSRYALSLQQTPVNSLMGVKKVNEVATIRKIRNERGALSHSLPPSRPSCVGSTQPRGHSLRGLDVSQDEEDFYKSQSLFWFIAIFPSTLLSAIIIRHVRGFSPIPVFLSDRLISYFF